MFEIIYSDNAAVCRHRNAPFADERERYLEHCAAEGATRATLMLKARTLLWLARRLESDAREGIDWEQLQKLLKDRLPFDGGKTSNRRMVDVGRPWLKFLGWWREPDRRLKNQELLDRYVTWMRDERGFARLTMECWQGHVSRFLRWFEQSDRPLRAVQPCDIDTYFISEGDGRWGRATISIIASALRNFLRYSSTQGACDPRLPNTIKSPRIYQQEGLPYAPEWDQVRLIVAHADTKNAKDIRDRAILMLLAIYGFRRGEVAALRLDQIDWPGHVIRMSRLKRRRDAIYPLVPSVAQALARYIDTVRPPTASPEVFIRLKAPWHAITASAIYNIVQPRFAALGIQTAHRGPHALRHACAARLIAQGLTIKEIGDHLGHRSVSATMIYAKVDMASLRTVGDFDLGDLQ